MALFPLLGESSENSFDFAQYDSETNILALSETESVGTKTYYGRTKLHLGADGTLQIIEQGEHLVNNFPVEGVPENYVPEVFQINKFDSKNGILVMSIVEVDRETAYRNVKIQLNFNSLQWSLLEPLKEEVCNFTIEQAVKLHSCMTLNEVEAIVGCPAVHKAQGGFASVGHGIGGLYIWRDLTVRFTTLNKGIERATFISSSKYDLSVLSARCE
jgi:hypothetical protein